MAIETISYTIGAVVYLAFFAALLTDKHRGRTKFLLLLAAFSSSVWASSIAVKSIAGTSIIVSQVFELAKNIIWLLFILSMLSNIYLDERVSISKKWVEPIKSFLIVGAVVAILLYNFVNIDSATYDIESLMLAVQLMLAVAGIVLIEQLYRNVQVEQRWVIKYLCLGLLGSYLYNFYMYSDALLYQRIDPVLWQTRGFIEAILVPLIAVSISKDPLWSPDIFISRRVVFHTATLLTSAIYLMIMGIAGYYVKEIGGSWGPVIQAFLLFVTIIVLVLILASRRIRARIKVLVNKHFYPYKYDYREEWLRFIRTVSFGDEHLHRKSIKSIAQIIDSPGGMLWLRQENGFFECVDSWEMPFVKVREPAGGSMTRFLEENEFVISVDELNEEPEVYNRLGHLELPSWLNEISPWLIVPLIHINKLIGFIILDHSVIQKQNFNWEDSDLLKTAARQVASHIVQQETALALVDAKQFESFNIITTYVVHDIKNLVAQLSLITSNAEKHKNNPLFMEDVISTLRNTVQKMTKMLDVVSGKAKTNISNKVDVIVLLEELIKLREMVNSKPVPELECESQSCFVKADKDQLLAIFGHLVQNAQDATSDDGDIKIHQSEDSDKLIIKFEDTGHGMDEDYIRTQLFKPFKSTKGKGMGIGVYETREIIHALGGTVDIESAVGVGTTFTIQLPKS